MFNYSLIISINTQSTSVIILGYYFKFIFLSLHFLLIALARQEEVKAV